MLLLVTWNPVMDMRTSAAVATLVRNLFETLLLVLETNLNKLTVEVL